MRKFCRECGKEILYASELEIYDEEFYHTRCMKKCRGCSNLIPESLEFCSSCSERAASCYGCNGIFLVDDLFHWDNGCYCSECIGAIKDDLKEEIKLMGDFIKKKG